MRNVETMREFDVDELDARRDRLSQKIHVERQAPTREDDRLRRRRTQRAKIDGIESLRADLDAIVIAVDATNRLDRLLGTFFENCDEELHRCSNAIRSP